MGRTIAEKILADHSEKKISPGAIVQVKYDLAATHDLSTPGTVQLFREWGGKEVADPDRLAIVPDHMVPSHNEAAQRNYTITKEFAHDQGIDTFYPENETGLMHAVLPDDGMVKPGDVVIGADSHTTTYGAIGAFSTGVGLSDMAFAWLHGWTWLRVPETLRLKLTGTPSEWIRGKDLALRILGELGVDGAVYNAIEYGGPAVAALPIDDRFSISNLLLEGGAQTVFADPDEKTRKYIDERTDEDYTLYEADDTARYAEIHEFDCDGMEPLVATPHLPENDAEVGELSNISVDQAVVGSCTNCRIEDLKLAAEVLEGHEIASNVRLIVTPGSRDIQQRAFEEGWMQTFHEAGAQFGSPGCGACFGEHIGVLDEDEVAIATTNRNFVGRMGANTSEVYLSNPAVAAASAVTGHIAHPEEVA